MQLSLFMTILSIGYMYININNVDLHSFQHYFISIHYAVHWSAISNNTDVHMPQCLWWYRIFF